MLIGAERVIQMASTYRLIHIDGRFGGGKTSLAVRLFCEFAAKGYRMLTNNACLWGEDIDSIEPDPVSGMLRLFCMIDEGGIYFQDRDDAAELVAYAAKMDMIFCLPSFEQPHRRLKALTIQPVGNWYSIGIPLIHYQYRLKSGMVEDKGQFYWLFPEEIYGVYSRQDPGEDTEYIMRWLEKQKNDYRARFGRKEARTKHAIINLPPADQTDTSAVEVRAMENIRRAGNTFADMADEIEESLRERKNTASLLERVTKSRRRP